MNKELCPCCLGAKQVMTPRETRGFEYTDCTLCNGIGVVSQELADDFILSLNEDNFEDDW